MKVKFAGVAALTFLLVALGGPVFSANAGGSTFLIKGGFDLMGESETDFQGYGGYHTETGDVKNGFSISAEGLMNMQSFMLGLGAAYMLPRAIDEDWPEGKFSRLPVYALAQIPFPSGDITPFLAVHLGYSFLFADSEMKDWWKKTTTGTLSTEGGFYWAVGGGIILSNNVQFEFLYRSQRGSFTLDTGTQKETFDTEYTHITLSIGYRF